ncbi:glutathione S-transferase [Penicillium hordei]|uniref:Glutathione S-transferase n=1 Tax=Penicillium hordei TaxID=40994 RepID=A0AAD6DMK2_9EURO|nr:glutathione S-transferase [Penicillium hordei]KAJ5589136.1 glutathione S-transferase [Penicillium hordei]
MAQNPNILLYTGKTGPGTPNGRKVSIMLEELGLPYEIYNLSIPDDEQRSEWYLKINASGRIPTIIDRTEPDHPVTVTESAAIMLYLESKYGKMEFSYPHGTTEYWSMMEWIFFQMSNIGPMQGQFNHFNVYAPEKVPYAIHRYKNETLRLYSIINRHLAQSSSGWLVGDKCTIADLINFTWIHIAEFSGIKLDEMPEFRPLAEWRARISARDGVKKGWAVPS